MTEETVAIYETCNKQYPQAPFDPPERFPECPRDRSGLDPGNEVYVAVRDTFRLLGMDSGHYGDAKWNPLGEFITPEDDVVIKPNLLYHYHPEGRLDAMTVHASILRAVIEYVFIAQEGKRRVTVAESPVWTADFKKLLDDSGISQMIEYLGDLGVDVEVIDMRETMLARSFESPKPPRILRLAGDPAGYLTVDLGSDSEFHGLEIDPRDYRNSMTNVTHNESVCRYKMPRTILNADVIISLAKLKTHVMAGNTLSLKNMVGAYGEKIQLPHYRVGSETSDEYPSLPIMRGLKRTMVKKLFKVFKSFPYSEKIGPVRSFVAKVTDESWNEPYPLWGMWYGNDTVWRMALDLNKIVLYADKQGMMERNRQRRTFAVIDGVVSGEGRGPIRPKPRNDGLVIAGRDFAATDLVATRLMGFDSWKIPILREALSSKDHRVTKVTEAHEIRCVSNREKWRRIWQLRKADLLNFEAPLSWRDHIEL